MQLQYLWRKCYITLDFLLIKVSLWPSTNCSVSYFDMFWLHITLKFQITEFSKVHHYILCLSLWYLLCWFYAANGHDNHIPVHWTSKKKHHHIRSRSKVSDRAGVTCCHLTITQFQRGNVSPLPLKILCLVLCLISHHFCWVELYVACTEIVQDAVEYRLF
jgi:hypothetical protein